ncbi:hypothetical protein WJX72_006344 [[Myrmecia] bisecta]|uniref:Ubiquitin-like domain-containing protein n=1 Tax=[Myrmecia] bisecta TaxID=41462 RepID=A0AAW1Q3T6_9CHLO
MAPATGSTPACTSCKLERLSLLYGTTWKAYQEAPGPNVLPAPHLWGSVAPTVGAPSTSVPVPQTADQRLVQLAAQGKIPPAPQRPCTWRSQRAGSLAGAQHLATPPTSSRGRAVLEERAMPTCCASSLALSNYYAVLAGVDQVAPPALSKDHQALLEHGRGKTKPAHMHDARQTWSPEPAAADCGPDKGLPATSTKAAQAPKAKAKEGKCTRHGSRRKQRSLGQQRHQGQTAPTTPSLFGAGPSPAATVVCMACTDTPGTSSSGSFQASHRPSLLHSIGGSAQRGSGYTASTRTHTTKASQPSTHGPGVCEAPGRPDHHNRHQHERLRCDTQAHVPTAVRWPMHEIALEYGGRWLVGGRPMSAYGVSPGATIHQRGRLRGGVPGGDGASAPGLDSQQPTGATLPGGLNAIWVSSSTARQGPKRKNVSYALVERVEDTKDATWRLTRLQPPVTLARIADKITEDVDCQTLLEFNLEVQVEGVSNWCKFKDLEDEDVPGGECALRVTVVTPRAGLADRYAGDAAEHAGLASRRQAGGQATAPRAIELQHLAARPLDPAFRWQEADRLLLKTFGPALDAQLARSRAHAAPPAKVSGEIVEDIGRSFPFVQREREVRAFVEDLRHLHGYHLQQNEGADIGSPPPPCDFTAAYERAPHLQLFLGPPGVGKTTLLRKLAPCIMDELDADPRWLKDSDVFRTALRSSMRAPIPFVFDLDLYKHVKDEF